MTPGTLNPEFEGKRCLDVGCNVGLMTMSMAYKFGAASMEGIDCDASLVARARKTKRSIRWPRETSGPCKVISLLPTFSHHWFCPSPHQQISVCSSTCPCIDPFFHPCIDPFMHPSIHPSIYPSIGPFMHRSISQSILVHKILAHETLNKQTNKQTNPKRTVFAHTDSRIDPRIGLVSIFGMPTLSLTMKIS